MNAIESALHALRSIPEWYSDADCASVDPGLWFPDTGQSDIADAAKAICDGCPVRQLCLEEALATRPQHDWGIRGGTTKAGREKIRRQRARGAA